MDDGAACYRRYLNGDEHAFDELMTALFDRLVFFVDRYVHDMHAAEDIAIDAFADLVVHRSRYNFKTTLKTYLFMIGRSRALNYLKWQKRRGTVELEAVEALPDDRQGLEEQLLQNEQRRALDRALGELAPDMRAAVHLVYFEGLSYAAAAQVMKKSAKQVDNLLCRAKGALRADLMREGERS